MLFTFLLRGQQFAAVWNSSGLTLSSYSYVLRDVEKKKGLRVVYLMK